MSAAVPLPLRLVPGLGLDRAAWSPTLARLAAGGRTDLEVVELHGYGRRGGSRADLRPGALAEELLAACPEAPVVLMGHSASCQVVAEAARQRPDRVAGLVLVGPTTDSRARSWPSLSGRWLATACRERPGQVPTLVRQYARTGVGTMVRAMDAARRHDVGQALAGARCPALVLRGRHDRICPGDWAAHLAGTAAANDPRSRCTTLDAGAHMVPLTHGRLVAAEVGRFLAGLAH